MDATQSAPSPQVVTASGPGSRITVVCAECKRLKLKCDRRTPCSSCTKRDAVSRCIYSPAAAERIDLQSLHNRVVTLESTIQSLVANGLRRAAPQAEYERTVLATGPTGSSSIVVSLEDVASVWLEQLEILKDVDLRVSAPEYHNGPSRLKIAFPDMGLFVDDASDLGRPQVTLQLIQQLPDRQTCEQLLNHLQVTMQMHPSFNFPNYRRRVEAMLDPSLYAASSNPSVSSCPNGSRNRNDNTVKRPSLAFFAAAVGGLALGARTAIATSTSVSDTSTGTSPPQPNTHPPGGPPPSSQHSQQNRDATGNLQNTADGLFMLSKQALAVTEFEQHYDLDFIHAVILNGLFLLHDGKPRVAHTIYPTVGKLINICRMMGLHIDPDEFPGKYSLFDAEARRRTWWDVYYYDLFLSDSMGQEPLIDDETCTTRLPADVDEEAFLPSSTSLPLPRPQCNSAYFIQKCRLARLIKTMRHRWVAEQVTIEMWVEATSDFESEITDWLNDLPPEFRIPSRIADPSTLPQSSPYLVAQRSELAAMANSLILKAYTPLLKRSLNKPLQAPHREAQHACSQAAHIIVNACHDLLNAFGQTRPASYVFYSFGRQIFAAAAISASIVIQTPRSLIAEPAMKDLERSLELMRHPVVANARGYGYGFAGAGAEGIEIAQPLPSSSLRIVEMLHAKATEALAGGGGTTVGTKRKHGDVDGAANNNIPHGFTIPFVGSSLVTAPSTTNANANAASSINNSPSARPSSPRSGPGPNKTRLRSSTGTSGVRRTGGGPHTTSDAGESQVSASGGAAPSTSSRPPTRISPGSMPAPPDPISTLGTPLGGHKKKSNSREKRGHPVIAVRNRAKSSTSRSQDERSLTSSEGTSSTVPSVAHPASANGRDAGVMSASVSETSSRPPTSASKGGTGPQGGRRKASSAINFSAGQPSPFHGPSSLPGDIPSMTPVSTGMVRSTSGSSYGAMQADAHPGYPYGGGGSTSGSSSIPPQQQRPGPSLFSASGEYVSHSTSSSPGASAYMLSTSSPYGSHPQPPGQPSYGSVSGSQDMGMHSASRGGATTTPPTPHSVPAQGYQHTAQPPPRHLHDAHMQSYPPAYDAMMHSGGMSATPQDNALPFSAQPTTSSPLGGPSFTSADIDMKPFVPAFSTFDQPSASSTGTGGNSATGAGFGGEAGPRDPSSAGALASGQRTPMSSYGGDSNNPAAQWTPFHTSNPYGQPLPQQQPQPQLHSHHQSQQPQNQPAYGGQHWNTTFYDTSQA